MVSLTWTLKYDTNELIYYTETDSQTQRADYVITKRGKVGQALTGSW